VGLCVGVWLGESNVPVGNGIVTEGGIGVSVGAGKEAQPIKTIINIMIALGL
jgi:hypothetical protein